MKENKVKDNERFTAKQAPTVVVTYHAITIKARLHTAYKLSPRAFSLHVENDTIYKGRLLVIYLTSAVHHHTITLLIYGKQTDTTLMLHHAGAENCNPVSRSTIFRYFPNSS